MTSRGSRSSDRLLEFGGGLALVVGLLTRLAAFGLALTMAGAILFVHGSAGLFMTATSSR